MRAFARRMRYTAAILAAVILLGFGAAMSIEAYRSRVFRFVKEVFEDMTVLTSKTGESTGKYSYTLIGAAGEEKLTKMAESMME